MFRIISTEKIVYNGQEREFDIVDRNLGSPAPRYFIGYNKGRPFISDEVPENYRKPMIFHELTEFETPSSQKLRCIDALKAELETVDPIILDEYKEFRKDVFKHLLEYFNTYEPESRFIPEIKTSLEHLING